MTQPTMKLDFAGCHEAELFSRELQETLPAVLAKNYVSDPESDELGFVSASIDGRPWTGAMWTRDVGVFLREMAHWGYHDHAVDTARCLMRHVGPNEDGFKLFPEHFLLGQQACAGTELDGTSAIIIGFVLLWQRLADGHAGREEIEKFLLATDSPVRGLLASVEECGLVSGSGEFGGGWDVPGEFYNVVQNNLVRLALVAVARFAVSVGDTDLAQKCNKAAAKILDMMMSKLRHSDGTWIWCRRAPGFEIDWDVFDLEKNAGFTGINGVLSMFADVFGLLPSEQDESWVHTSERTFMNLLARPARLRQFAAYGFWAQWDRMLGGFISSAYGWGYAIPCMMLLDLPDMYTAAINWLARTTYELVPQQVVHRDSDYWFYEGYWSPDAVGKSDMPEGCGALNLVNAMEPLKIARMILGMDDHDRTCTRLVPRLPRGWTGATAENVPVLVASGTIPARIEISADQEGTVERVNIRCDETLTQLEVRLGTAQNPHWHMCEDATEAVFE